uniref:Uncharacterized protein n=1 Tax=Cacopsylla melanoneura TaxID=428564 RepID=A0A8D8X3E7_9HEMI
MYLYFYTSPVYFKFSFLTFSFSVLVYFFPSSPCLFFLHLSPFILRHFHYVHVYSSLFSPFLSFYLSSYPSFILFIFINLLKSQIITVIDIPPCTHTLIHTLAMDL